MESALLKENHGIELAMVHPQIAANAGNVARLSVATGTPLHWVRPLGFVMSDAKLKRSAMDYWPRLRLTVHDDLAAFEAAMTNRRVWLLTSKGTASLWTARFEAGDVLLMGSEQHGIPEALHQAHAARRLRIPQAEGERCLNVSTAAGIALYEALRQVGAPLTP